MTAQHLGFRVSGISPTAPFVMHTDTFEVRQSAIECAQLLDAAHWTEIRCVMVTSRVQQHDWDTAEILDDIEWQCHVIGSDA